ncbi:MAG: hypothetical protein Q8R08_02975 [bacterium]|nr:hypothetical protein [bacterium]
MKEKVNKTDSLTNNDLEKERVERLEKWAEKVSEKVGIKLEK